MTSEEWLQNETPVKSCLPNEAAGEPERDEPERTRAENQVEVSDNHQKEKMVRFRLKRKWLSP